MSRVVAASTAALLAVVGAILPAAGARALPESAAPRAAVDAPRNVVAEPGTTGGTATVSWSAPSAPSGTLLGYTVEARDSSGNPILSTRTDAPASSLGPVTISSLSNGASYTFVVYSRYAGNSAVSDPSGTVVPFTVPAAPAVPSAVRSGPGTVTVTWLAPSDNGGRAITSYVVTCSPACTSVSTAALTANIVGLTTTTAYTFSVAAVNARGESAASLPSTTVTPYGPPSAPQSVTGTRGNGQVTMSWSAPASDGGSAITGYTATASPGGEPCTWTTGPLTCTITNLKNGTSYTVTVTASNANETPGPGAQVANLIPATRPSAPVVSATAGDTTATVSWSVPNDGGSAITGYTATASPGPRTCTGDGSATSCIVTDLTNGQAYTFTVTASNGVGNSDASAASNAVTPAPVTAAPSIVRSVAAVRTGSGAVNVTWVAPSSNGGAAITQYELQYRIGTSGDWTSASSTASGGATAYAFSGLTNGASYFFRVAARNASNLLGPYGLSPNPAVPGTVPAKVTGLTATPASQQVALSWAAPSANGYAINDYRVEYRPASGGNWILVDDTSTSTSFTVTGLTNATAYDFRVRAINALGEGPNSDTVRSTPTNATPSPSASPTAGPTSSPSPSPSPTSSPSPSPSPTSSPAPTPSPTSSPAPAPTPGPSGGLKPGDPDDAEPVPVRKPPARSEQNAPTVEIPRGEDFALSLRGLPPGQAMTFQVKSRGGWRTLGNGRVTKRGTVSLPPLDAARLGAYIIRLKPKQGKPYFIEVVVVRRT